MLDTKDTSVKSLESKTITVEQKKTFLLDCIRQNWHIFPLHVLDLSGDRPACGCRRGAQCSCPGKHPLGRWSLPLPPDAPGTPRVIEARLASCPGQGWGLHLGLSGVMVLDVDPRNGGDDALELLCADLGLRLPAPTVLTGGGGRHYYFPAPAGTDPRKGWAPAGQRQRTSVVVAPGIELLCGQHYVVLPYSPHRSGRQYTAAAGVASSEALAPLLSFLAERESQRYAEPDPRDPVFVPAGSPVVYAGPAAATHAAAAARARAWLAARPPAVSGQGGRAHTSATAAKLVIDFALPLEDAYALLCAWNAGCVPPWPEQQLREILEWAQDRPGERGRALRERVERIVVNAAAPHTLAGGESTAPLHRCASQQHDAAEARGSGLDGVQPLPLSGRETSLPVPIRRAPSAPSSPDQPSARKPSCTSRGERCNCWWSQLFREKQGQGFQVLRIRGKRWDCPECGPARRKHMIDSIAHRIQQYAQDRGGLGAISLYIGEVSWVDWKWVGHRIRAAKGLQLRVAWQCRDKSRGQTCLVLSTAPVAGVEWQGLSGTEAIARMREVVLDLSDTIRTRVYWSSRAWRLVPLREQTESAWRSCGPVFGSWAAIKATIHGMMVRATEIDIPCPYYGSWGLRGQCDDEVWEWLRSALTQVHELAPTEEETLVDIHARDFEAVTVQSPFPDD